MLRVPEKTRLVVGGARRAGGRCIIPIIRALAVYGEETAAVILTPVALLVAEGENEYLTLLPGAPPETRDIAETLRDEIEREKKKCAG